MPIAAAGGTPPPPPRVKVLPATPRLDGLDEARFFTTYETPRSEVVVFMSEPSDKDRPAPGWLKKSDMAASLGISVQAFDKWGVKPVKKIGRNVYFDVRSVVDNRIENAIQKHQPTDPQDMDEDQLDFQRWRLTKEQADKAERENRIAERHQVPTEFATFALTRIAAKVSSLLDTVPLTMRRRYPELQTKHIEGLQRELVIASNEAASLGDLLPELLDEYIDSTSK